MDGYENMVTWWNNLSDDWKRLLLMKSNSDDPLQYDISKTPSISFFIEIFERKIFNNLWQRITTLKPLNFINNLEKLILEFVNVRDFVEISNMTSIKIIHADFSKIESLEGLENFENLQILTLANTNVSTLKPIASLKNISFLSIRGTLIPPEEVEIFKSLHPLAKISFVTPWNPLRRNTYSLENPLLDYYKALSDGNIYIESELLAEGIRLSHDQRYIEAIKKFDKVLLINPLNFRCLIERGIAKHISGDLNGSIIDFDIVIENSKENIGIVYYYRGKSKFELNNFDDALSDYYVSIKHDPNLEQAYIEIKEIYLLQQNYNGVLEILGDLIKRFPNNSNHYYDIGITYGFLNDYRQAIFYMDKVLEFSPNDGEALYNRGAAKLNIGLTNAGLKDLEKSRNLGFHLAIEFFNENSI